MGKRIVIRAHEYYDSVRLMQVSERVRREAGVTEAILMMATENNKRLLGAAGLLDDAVRRAAADDLVIAIKADSDEAAEQALAQALEWLAQRAVSAAAHVHRTLESAQNALPDANLALISVPGSYAAAEARRALERGLHVLLFSDNVSLEDELALKQLAQTRGRLLMGPDCGTAIIGGIGLGFANAVRRGSVGIVGASGTGIQEICVLLDRRGFGVSHAIGTGGRDLKTEIGGITMLQAIDALDADPGTEVIILTSKPPAPAVAQRVIARAAACGKPVVVNFLGGDAGLIAAPGLIAAHTLEDAAVAAARLLSAADGAVQTPQGADHTPRFAAGQRYLRGLFSGGTLCFEAMLLLQQQLGAVYSNIALRAEFQLDDLWRSRDHTLVDLGDDAYTKGRAHPMIDPTLRLQRLLQEARDPEVAVILLDVVLGFGAHDDPAGKLAETVCAARDLARREGRELVVVAAVCGTEADPQQRSRQEARLREAGVLLAEGNAAAARLAAALVPA